MIFEVLRKGVELMSAPLPLEWDESISLRLEDRAVNIILKNGKAVLVLEDNPDAESIIRLGNKRLCNIIDGSIDFMKVWRELAEPSPTDRTYILKGSGAKLFTLLDGLIKCYRTNEEFKELLDDYKAHITA